MLLRRVSIHPPPAAQLTPAIGLCNRKHLFVRIALSLPGKTVTIWAMLHATRLCLSGLTGVPLTMEFEARLLDDDPVLLEQGYRLRYQVDRIERGAPSRRRLSGRHWNGHTLIGIRSMSARWTATASSREPRVLSCPTTPGSRSFTTARSFLHETTLDEARQSGGRGVTGVNQRDANRRRDDPPFGAVRSTGTQVLLPPRSPSTADRRRRRAEPFRTLLNATIYGAKAGARHHSVRATRRRLPSVAGAFRVSAIVWLGPEADYDGRVAPLYHESCGTRSGDPQRTISRARRLPGRSGTIRPPAGASLNASRPPDTHGPHEPEDRPVNDHWICSRRGPLHAPHTPLALRRPSRASPSPSS